MGNNADFTPNRHPQTPLRPFRAWVQKVLPQAYDDSLSYYELLSRVLSCLNTQIDNLNALGEDVTDLYNAYNLLQEYVNTYFDNLDYQEAINDAIDALVLTGQFNTMFIDAVSDTTSRWLDHNIHEGYEVDSSLTQSGFAADAKVTGDRFKETIDLRGTRATTLEDGTDFNLVQGIGNYVVTPNESARTMVNCPANVSGRLIVSQNTVGNRRVQFYIPNSENMRIYVRYYNTSEPAHWSKWVELGEENSLMLGGGSATVIPENADLNTFNETGNYRVNTNARGASILNIPIPSSGRLTVLTNNQSGNITQFFMPNTKLYQKIYYRYGAINDLGGVDYGEWYVIDATPVNKKQLKILAVGNSYSYHATRYLWKLLHDNGYDVTVGIWYYGGARLSAQYEALMTDINVGGNWTGGTLEPYYKYTTSVNPSKTDSVCFSHVLTDEKWDVVIFQQASVMAGQYESYVSDTFDIKNLQSLIASRIGSSVSDIRWGIMLPWSYATGFESEDFETYYGSDSAVQLEANKTVVPQVANYLGDCFVVNVGVAIDRGRANTFLNQIGVEMCRPTNEDNSPDLSHLEEGIPRLIASMVYATTITGESPFSFNFYPVLDDATIPDNGFLQNLSQAVTCYAVEYVNINYETEGTVEERLATLESASSTQALEINGKVDKTGDTMGGYLYERNYGYEDEDPEVKRIGVGSHDLVGHKVKYMSSGFASTLDSHPRIVVHGEYGRPTNLTDSQNPVDEYPKNISFYANIADYRYMSPSDYAKTQLDPPVLPDLASEDALDVIADIPVRTFKVSTALTADDERLTDETISGETFPANTRTINFGILGQDIRNVDRDLVYGGASGNNYWSLNVPYILALLIKAIQELDARIAILET